MSDEVQSKFPAVSNKVKTALNNDKLTLYTPSPDGTGKSSRLTWDLVSNNPRIICYTNIPEDNVEAKNWGRISANMDSPTFWTFLEMLEKVADSEPDTKIKIDNRGYTWIAGKRSDQTLLLSELFVGKDKEGCVWLSITAPDRPKIKFTFNNSDYHAFYHGNGEGFTKSETSILLAKAYAKLLRHIYGHMAVTNFVDINALAEQKKQEAGNRQGGGGYQNRQGGNGGYQNRQGGNGNYNRGNYNNDRGNGNYNRQAPEIDTDDIPF